MSILHVTGEALSPDVTGRYAPDVDAEHWIRDDGLWRIWHNSTFSRYDFQSNPEEATPFSLPGDGPAGTYDPFGGSPGTGNPIVTEEADDPAVTVTISPLHNTITATLEVANPGDGASGLAVQWGAGAPWIFCDPLGIATLTFSTPGSYAVTARAMVGGVTYTSATQTVVISADDIAAAGAGAGGDSTMSTIVHGVATTIAPSLVMPVRQVNAGLPVIIAQAPTQLIDGSGTTLKNVPVLCLNKADFTSKLGWSDDATLYPACEAANVFFDLYNVGPIIIINPADPVVAGVAVTAASATLVAGAYTLAVPNVVLSTLVVKSSDGNTTYTLGTEYTTAYDADGQVVITRKGTTLAATAALKLDYKHITSASVTANDVIAAIPAIDKVFPMLQMIPGQLLAPGWTETPGVAAPLAAKTHGINTMFMAECLTDIDTSAAASYETVAAWIGTNSYTDANQVNAWPQVVNTGVKQHLSLHLAALACYLDSQNNDIPFVSPSNKALRITGAALANGTPVFLGPEQFMCSLVPFVTAINFQQWAAWGNRLGAFATSTDPLTFWCNRRMMNWVGKTLALTFWQAVDGPISRRRVEGLLDSAQQWLNSLVARGAMLGARVEFPRELNSDADLANGKLSIRYSLGLESPAELISNTLQFDASYYSSLF